MPSPDHLSPPRPRVALFLKLLAFAIVFAIGSFVAQFGAEVLKVVAKLSDKIGHPILMVPVVLIVSGVFLRVFERKGLNAIGIGFDRRWVRQLAGGVLFGAAMMLVVWAGLVFTGQATWRLQEGMAERIPALVIAVIFAVAVAVTEELLCRGYAFQILCRWDRMAAIVASGLYFVVIHLVMPGGGHPLVAINMLLAHLVYVVMFLRTRSLWPCIGFHFSWNFMLAFVLGMPLSGISTPFTLIGTSVEPSLWGGQAFGPEGGLAVTVALGASLLLLWRFLPERRPTPSLIDASPDAADSSVEASRSGGAIGAAGPFASPVAAHRPGQATGGLPVLALAPQSERFAALDMLRALALFGILPMNIQGFALHDAAVLNPYACEWTDSLNVGVWAVFTALFGRKDLMLFAMIFGAGIVMVSDRCTSAGRHPLALHAQRMGALMLIGIVHAYLVWSGDILFTYSVCGFVVYFCRYWSPKRLIGLGSLLYLAPLAMLVGAQLLVPHLQPRGRDLIWAAYQPGAEEIAAYYEAYRGSWWSQMAMRVPGALTQHTFLLLIAMGWVSAGMMLIGMGLYRLGYQTAGVSRKAFRTLLAWSAPLGVGLTALWLWMNFERGWKAEFSFFIGRLPGELASPFMALAVVAGATLLFTRKENGVLGHALAAVGRMSLTNYLTHSVILTFLFYGTGLGWIGRVDRVQQTIIVIAIWMLQLVVSPLWLSRFQFGPAEWLWRSMAYWKWQPMRRSAVDRRSKGEGQSKPQFHLE